MFCHDSTESRVLISIHRSRLKASANLQFAQAECSDLSKEYILEAVLEGSPTHQYDRFECLDKYPDAVCREVMLRYARYLVSEESDISCESVPMDGSLSYE